MATLTEQEAIRLITERMIREFDPLKVILFGSRARGEPRMDSDFDLLVVVPDEAGWPEQWAASAAVKDLPVAKDILVIGRRDLEQKGGHLGSALRPALREGVVLYDRDEEELVVAGVNPGREANDWLGYAQEDLTAAVASLAVSEFRPRHACYYAQQAAEKALKAALISLTVEPPRTHSLDELRDLLPLDWSVKTRYPNLKRLTGWIASGRYPDSPPAPSDEDAAEAVKEARGILETLVGDMRRHGLLPADPS
jgi:HEPN domain-containing protein/predicted nucleotidyltransferase